MLRLLNIEFQKLRYNRSSKVLSIIYLVLICFLAFFASIKFDFGNLEFHLAEQGIFNFPLIWHFNAYMAAWLKIFLAVVIVSMIANEYSNRTLKQNLIDGMSKKEFILSKFYTVVGFSFISTVILFIVSLVLGLIYSDYNDISIIFSQMIYIPAYFLKLVAFFSFCLFLSILVRRSAFALGFLVVWWIFESIVSGLIQFQFLENKPELADAIVQFFPLVSMSNLVPQPFSKLGVVQAAGETMGATLEVSTTVPWYSFAIVIVWTFLFIYFSYALLKKRDL